MRLLAFVARYNGHIVTAPGGDGGQCVDLTNLYLIDVLIRTEIHHNASDWATAHITGLRWVANDPTNFPPAGAIVVWHDYPPHGIGPNGHIAVAVAADSQTLISFDQNWPDGSPCALTVHDYGGVLGWWQPA